MLLSGHLCDARIWARQGDALGDIADPMVPILDAHDLVAGIAADVLLWAPPRFALAGFSLGGFVAIEVILRAP